MEGLRPLLEDMMDVKKLPGWLYHAKHEARIFTDQAEYDAALNDGWVDSPAKVEEAPDTDAVDIPAEVAVMDRDTLAAYALEHLGWTLPRNVKVDNLKAQVAAKMAEKDK